MKRAMVVVILIIVALILCGCGKTITGEDGKDHYLLGRFIEIEEINYKDKYDNKVTQRIVYDRTTKVVYVQERGIYGIALSPYYINNNGIAEIAIYGINYY